MKPREVEQCRANAIYCLIIWFRLEHRTSFERIQYHLQKHLWEPAAQRYKTDFEKIRVLTSTRDPAAVSIVSSLLETRALQESQRADSACRARERAAARSRELDTELADAKASRAASQAKVSRLENEIERRSRDHAHHTAQLQDDYEQLRGQVLRRLRGEVDLLDEGLHALRREPPKIRVMIDHAERAIDGLKHEMEQLRRNG